MHLKNLLRKPKAAVEPNGFSGPDSAVLTAATVPSSGGPSAAPVLSSPAPGSITWTAVIPLTDAVSTGYVYEYAKAVDSSAPADSITGLWSIPTTTSASSAGQLIGGPTGYIRVAAYTPAGLGPWSNIVHN